MDPSSAEMDTTPDCNESNIRDSFAERRKAQERDNVQSRFHRAVQAGNVQVALSLIRHGADVNDPNPDGETALHTAVFCPNAVSMIDLLLKEEADLNLQNPSYQTPLVHAIDGYANINVIQLLLDNESDTNIGDSQGSTALHYAMKYNPNADRLVQLLLRHDADPYKADSDRKLPIHKVKGTLTDEHGVEITNKVLNALIQHDLVHNRVDNNKKSALFYAAQFGTTGLVEPPTRKKRLNRSDGTIEITDKFERTALHYAGMYGWGADSLLEHGVFQREVDIFGETPLSYAIRFSNERPLRDILLHDEGAARNADAEGKTPLHYAVQHNCTSEILRELLKAGAAVDTMDSKGKTPLHYAAEVGADVRELLDSSTDIDTVDEDGRTALHYAAGYNHTEVYQALVGHQQNLSLRDTNGRTALHEAAAAGAIEIVTDLLARGTQLELADHNQRTALHEAARAGSSRIVQMLLTKGMDSKTRSSQGDTALHEAARNGSSEVILVLLKNGADIEARNGEGKTPLHLAGSADEALDAITVLLDNNADITARDEKGCTVLHHAAAGREFLPVKLLLDRGADITVKDNRNATAFHYAMTYGSPLTARRLLDRGATKAGLAEAFANIFPMSPLNISINPLNNNWVSKLLSEAMLRGGSISDIPSVSAFEWQVPHMILKFNSRQEGGAPTKWEQLTQRHVELLNNIVIFAGSSGYFEAQPCRKFVSARYDHRGQAILDLIQKAIHTRSVVSHRFKDEAVFLQATPTHLIVCKFRAPEADAEPTTFHSTTQENDTVEEVVEFICRALRPPVQDGKTGHWMSPAMLTPVFTEFIRIYQLPELRACTAVDIEGADAWTRLFQNATIVETEIKRSWGRGLKIAYDTMLHQANIHKFETISRGAGEEGVYLRGPFSALVPVEQRNSRKRPGIRYRFIVNRNRTKVLTNGTVNQHVDWIPVSAEAIRQSESFVG